MKLWYIFQVYHLLKYWIVKCYKHEIFAFINFLKKFLKIERNSLLFKDAKSFCYND